MYFRNFTASILVSFVAADGYNGLYYTYTEDAEGNITSTANADAL